MSTKIVDTCLRILSPPQARKIWALLTGENRRHVSTNIQPAAGAKILFSFDRKNRRHVSTNFKPAAGAKFLVTFDWENRRHVSTNSEFAAGAKFVDTFDKKIVDTCLRILSPPQARKFWALLTEKS